MNETSIRELKEAGEQAGLQGDTAKALASFELAFIQAANQENDAELLNCIAHIAIIYKHQFHTLAPEDPHRIPFVEMMGAYAMAGVRIADQKAIIGQPRSAAILRVGDYYYAKSMYQQAADTYHDAIEEMKNYEGLDKDLILAEYRGHYGQALGMIGDETGIKELNEALQTIEGLQEEQVRPFHKLIILTGIFMRLAEVYLHLGKQKDAENVLAKALPMAEDLAQKYDMPDRRKQLEKFKEVYNLNF